MKTGITILLLFLATLMYAAPCGIHGSAKRGSREYALNPFKNRSEAPRTVNPRITLKVLANGARFENNEAAAIIGYVALVKPGGRETCNCRATDVANANDESKHVVVELTPRTRRLYHFPSTTTLKKQILHKRVMVTGWLFYDSMHEGNAANTNPHGKSIWRATCEEITLSAGSKFFISDRLREGADHSHPLDG
jgi:hypothetical protein